jgi:hypothetical protein
MCSHTSRILFKTAAAPCFPYFQASGKISYFFSARLAAASRRTWVKPGGCSIHVAVGKYQISALPSMRTAHAHVVGIAVGDFPPCRHGERLVTILKYAVIVHFATMKGHVEVGAVALRGGRVGGGGGGGRIG